MAPPVVAGHELTKRYGEGDAEVNAVRGVSLEIQPGSFTAIMGPSGSGKSTLMHLLAGLDRPSGGTVTIADTEIGKLDDTALTRLRRDKVGFVFQAFNLVPVLTAEENVRLPARAGARAALLLPPFTPPPPPPPGGNPPPPAAARGPGGGGGPRGAAAGGGAARRPPHPPPGRAVGRPAAARRGGPGARFRA